jgi:uncharacterized protein YndB with AHSA1/START domain
MHQKTTCTVTITHKFSVRAETVFDAWLDPQIAGKFLFVTPGGIMRKVEIDARVGGQFCIIENRHGNDAEHVGEYLEIARPHRLQFSFGGKPFPATLVSLTIQELGNGCELRLFHDGVWLEYEASVNEGWKAILTTLSSLLSS